MASSSSCFCSSVPLGSAVFLVVKPKRPRGPGEGTGLSGGSQLSGVFVFHVSSPLYAKKNVTWTLCSL